MNGMNLYLVVLAVITAVQVLLAVQTRRKRGYVYTRLDKLGGVLNVLLIPGYLCCCAFFLFAGLIVEAAAVPRILCFASPMVCGAALCASTVLRRKGISIPSFLVQFAAVPLFIVLALMM